jgi:hypothetical protein
MAAVTATTKSDSPKIEWAGVDAGAKIFVGLRERSAESASAAAGTQSKIMTCAASGMRQLEAPLIRISLTSSQFTQERAAYTNGSLDIPRVHIWNKKPDSEGTTAREKHRVSFQFNAW